MYTVTKRCPFCDLERTLNLPVTREQVRAYWEGALIQDAMPNLTPDEREHIKTGICPSCWDGMEERN